MKQALASVISNAEAIPGTYLIWLESHQIAAEAKPGQFVMVRCGKDNEWLLRRPLSIHQQDDNKIALLFDVVGKGTHWLAQCKPRNKIDLLGPLGNGYSIKPTSCHLLLLAGGIGIAPLYFLAQESIKKGYKVVLLYGTADDKRYPISPGIEVAAATENGAIGHKGMITDLLPEYTDWADQVFACGPVPMYRDIAGQQLLKTKPVQISLEARMGCGVGVCYGCTVRTKNGVKQVCHNGPVFDLEDIIWDELACND